MRYCKGTGKLRSDTVLLSEHQLHYSIGMQEVGGLKRQSGTSVTAMAELTVAFKQKLRLQDTKQLQIFCSSFLFYLYILFFTFLQNSS